MDGSRIGLLYKSQKMNPQKNIENNEINHRVE